MNETNPAGDCCNAAQKSEPKPVTGECCHAPAVVAAPAPMAKHDCCHGVAAAGAPTGPAVVRAAGTAAYFCPMCPGVESDAPGSCPKCGMALESALPIADAGEDPELRDMSRRFWIALALTVPLVLYAMAGMGGRLPLALAGAGLPWVQFALATPVVLWCGWPLLARGWR